MTRVAILLSAAVALVAAAPALDVRADRSEAEAALVILEKLQKGVEPAEQDWRKLFATDGYRRLKEREVSMKREFTDDGFRTFLRSPEARSKASGWRRAFDAWSPTLAGPAAEKAFAYLPANAVLRATVYPTIKPRPNEFVFDVQGNPAIFLYLDPEVSAAKSANTMAHELHHIGFGSGCTSGAESRDPGVATLRKWMSAFGEGLAMLAAAGGPDVHPHFDSSAAERAEWDRNAALFGQQLAEQNSFFLKVLEGSAGDLAAIDSKMMGYFGTAQGPWYTVGWRMGQVIERNFGRARVIDAFCRSETLLATYNAAALREEKRSGARLPTWDSRLAAALAAPR